MLAGLILAGGRSSRMGTDKSLLTLPENQISLLESAQKQLELVCNNLVLTSGEQHAQGIPDCIPNCGPLSGIHAAVTRIEFSHPDINELLVVAVDMPDLRAADYHHLLKIGRKNQRLCSFERCYLPLYIPLSNSVKQYLDSQLSHRNEETPSQTKKSQYSLKNMINSLQGLQIAPLQKTRLDNINTPAQWQKYCAEQPKIKD
jgi:molybdopterin-guanine dinucleotide biosynthesis protein A